MPPKPHPLSEKAGTGRMPLLFLGHGSPMNAIEENRFVDGFRAVAQTLPRPKAVLCISAHWYIQGTRVTAMEEPRTIHDFYGFPQELYKVQYPAPGSPSLAHQIQELLRPSPVALDREWGLDHGTWSVTRHLYPLADVPVVQLSIDYTKPAEFHFELAGKLGALRDSGVLIVGSGNIVHNLQLVDFENMGPDDYGYDWAIEARETINRLLLEGDYRQLVNYEKMGEAVHQAIPTPDHFLPLLYVLGLQAPDEKITLFNDSLVAGSLSMTSLTIA